MRKVFLIMVKIFAQIPLTVVLLLSSCSDTAPTGVSPSTAWRPNGCEFLVHFPEEPETSVNEISGISRFETASLVVEDAAFRADCMTVTSAMRAALPKDDEDLVRAVLNENARSSGISPVEISVERASGFVKGIAKGSKQVESRPVMYQMNAYIRKDSLMSTMVGAPSNEFPAPGQMDFLNSVSVAR